MKERRMAFHFVADAPLHETDDMVRNHHYSHRPATGCRYRAALADDTGRLVAAVMFRLPPTRWSRPVIELTRLVRLPDVRAPLTSLISKACADLRRRKLADLLVSFADSTQGHHGGVYQAASWKYHEQRKAQNDGFLLDGEFVPRRTAYGRFGGSSRVAMRVFCEVWGYEFQEHWDTGKHLYWRALTRQGEQHAKELGLRELPYPKTDSLPLAEKQNGPTADHLTKRSGLRIAPGAVCPGQGADSFADLA